MSERSLERVAAVAVVVSLAAATGVAAAAGPASIDVQPDEPRATATHEVIVTVGNQTDGRSLTGLQVDYRGTGTDVSDVSAGDVVVVGIDRDGDSPGRTVDVNVGADLKSVDISGDGAVLTATFAGSYTLYPGDEIVLVYKGVTNPKAGTYRVPVDINPQSSGGTATAVLSIGSQPNDKPSKDAGESSAFAPGFGVGTALLAAAVAALGLLARRR